MASILADDIRVNRHAAMQPGLQFSDMKIDEDETEINIADNSFNDTDFVFDINRYRLLEHFKVGENACRGVSSFIIDNLNHLKSIEIGKLSFTLSSGPIVTRAFTILNCSELESIVLHPNNFSDYAHSFNLINLPSLKYLQIGEVGTYSTNFYKLSFSLKSSQSLFLLPFRPSQARNCDFRQRSLPIFRHYCVRRFAILSFFFSFLDLPSLETIRLGEKALMGCDDEWCQLSMKRCDGFCD